MVGNLVTSLAARAVPERHLLERARHGWAVEAHITVAPRRAH